MPSEMVLYFFSNLYCVNCVLVKEEKYQNCVEVACTRHCRQVNKGTIVISNSFPVGGPDGKHSATPFSNS